VAARAVGGGDRYLATMALLRETMLLISFGNIVHIMVS
jgi:hypothetical protein